MSIQELVDSIEHPDQLSYAKELIDDKLKAHYEQQRELVWEVSDKRNFTVEWFKGDDYLKAAKFVFDKAVKMSEKGETDHKTLTLRLEPKYWLESEYIEYFEEELYLWQQ